MPPLAGESSKSATRAVKIPSSHNSNNHNHRRQPRVKSTLIASESSFSSSTSSTESFSPSKYQASTSAYPSTSRGPHIMNKYSTSDSSPNSNTQATPISTSKQKAPVTPGTASSTYHIPQRQSPLGPSMLSSHTYRSVNLNSPTDDYMDEYEYEGGSGSSSSNNDTDYPPRLITFTRSGQGFTWNEELFLPSYMVGRYGGGRRRKQYDGDLGEDDVEVAEIWVSEEEARGMLP